MADMEKIRMQIEAIMEENKIENYIVIFSDGETTFDIHSLSDLSTGYAIIGFMEYIKQDLLHKFADESYLDVVDDDIIRGKPLDDEVDADEGENDSMMWDIGKNMLQTTIKEIYQRTGRRIDEELREILENMDRKLWGNRSEGGMKKDE